MSRVKETARALEEVVLEVRVQPRASRNEILGYQDGVLRLRVTAPPVEGEANRAVKRLIAEAMGVASSRVEIVGGERGRRKRVRVSEVPPGSLERLKAAGGKAA